MTTYESSLIQARRSTEPARLAELAQAHDVTVVRAVAGNPATPVETLLMLLGTGSELTFGGLATNPSLPAREVLAHLVGAGPRMHEAAAANTPHAQVYAQLLESPQVRVRAYCARNLQLDPVAELRLARDPEELVRTYLGCYASCREAQELLVEDPRQAVRSALAENPQCAPGLLVTLARDPSAEVRQHVASNSSSPPEALAALMGHACTRTHWALAHRGDLPGELLGRLRVDGMPPETLKRLLGTLTGTTGEVAEALSGSWLGSFESLVEAAGAV